MKDKFNVQENQGVKITLASSGFTPAAAFFIVLSLVFTGFLGYAVATYGNLRLQNIDMVSAFVILIMVLVSSIVLFMIVYSLSNEIQEISMENKQLVISKRRPMWPGMKRTVNLDQVDGFAMEKLAFNFMNVWYAFIFHKDFGADEVENFLSPQVRFAGKSISFLESADETTKRAALEKLKKEFSLETV